MRKRSLREPLQHPRSIAEEKVSPRRATLEHASPTSEGRGRRPRGAAAPGVGGGGCGSGGEGARGREGVRTHTARGPNSSAAKPFGAHLFASHGLRSPRVLSGILAPCSPRSALLSEALIVRRHSPFPRSCLWVDIPRHRKPRAHPLPPPQPPPPTPVTSGVREQARQTKHASMWLLVISCESMCILKIMLRGWRCEGRLAAGWWVGGREGVGAMLQGNAIARKKGRAN